MNITTEKAFNNASLESTVKIRQAHMPRIIQYCNENELSSSPDIYSRIEKS